MNQDAENKNEQKRQYNKHEGDGSHLKIFTEFDADAATSRVVQNQTKKIKHNVLNAKQHEKEARIIAEAGKVGAVTIATNMAGRGTDIILGGNPTFKTKEKILNL